MKLVIIGGVAGGASAAARARRLSEDAEIVVLERGDHPSFANCGLPYYVGGEIESRDRLLVAPVAMLRQRHRLDVRTRCEVVRIDRDERQVIVRDRDSNVEAAQPYDRLIIATGASPVRPSIPGMDGPRVMTLRDLNDADRMHAIATSGIQRAAIIGAGFIGMEVAENLVRRGVEVTVVERNDQILTAWDREMVLPIESHLRSNGVTLRLSDSANRIIDHDSGLTVELASGETLDVDMAVVCVGVQPESHLAAEAGLQCGSRGGVVTNEHMQTSDPAIYAVGDVAEVADFMTNHPVQVPLAGPANRQGRIAADHIFGRSSTYRGTQGTAIVGVFGRAIAMTGQSEKQLRRSGTGFEKIYIHPSDHANYYPGATGMTLKLIFDPNAGTVLGAQCVGTNGVDKRIDVIAMAIQAGMTVDDLCESELCYAPQFGHAKDPVNMAGFVASGVVGGDHPIAHCDALAKSEIQDALLLDVRSPAEFDAGHLPGAINRPIETLREQLDDLPREQPVVAYCQVGQRGYLATRVLRHHGFEAVNLSGGYKLWSMDPDRPVVKPSVTPPMT